MLRSIAAPRFTVLALFLTFAAACERSTTVPTAAPAPDLSMSDAPIELAAPRHSGGVVTRTIGPAGGTLVFSDPAARDLTFQLDVPAGAVSAPTTFRMNVIAGTTYGVDLSAMAGRHNVGEHGFALPVRLTISYGSANLLKKLPGQLAVAWFPGHGQAPVSQYTTLDVYHKTATGYLPHFSKYGLIVM